LRPCFMPLPSIGFSPSEFFPHETAQSAISGPVPSWSYETTSGLVFRSSMRRTPSIFQRL
jgi:hypothetical protein